MKTLRFLPLLAVPALLALDMPRADISFAPSSDASIEMTYENNAEFFLDELSVNFMGNDMGGLIGAIDASVNIELESTFTDTYRSVEDGQPMSFQRVYGAANIGGEGSMEAQGESESNSFSVDSALENATVSFKWDEEEEEYTRAFVDDEEADDTLLQGLLPRLDLAFMLPEEGVSVDDEWQVDAIQIASLLVPGGDLAYDVEGRDEADFSSFDGGMDSDEAYDTLVELIDGDVTAKFKGMREDDESHLAEIQITMDISGEEDFADKIVDAILAGIEASGGDVPTDAIPEFNTFALSVAFDGEGTLMWDVRAGHAASFTMSSEVEVALAVNVAIDAEGMAGEVDGEIILGGAAEISMEASY
jgi:hypothetical protein